MHLVLSLKRLIENDNRNLDRHVSGGSVLSKEERAQNVEVYPPGFLAGFVAL